MTDITSTLNRIRELALSGRTTAYGTGEEWYCEQFEAILHNVNRLEAAMTTDTDTTDEAQWRWVEHDHNGAWSAQEDSIRTVSVSATSFIDERWTHVARVHCPSTATEHDIYQAACDAWADAGFQHAPKQAPGPKRVEVTRWGVLHKDYALSHQTMVSMYAERDQAERVCSTGCRIVKVAATISEVTE